MHDDDVVVIDALDVGIIGGEFGKDGFEFGLVIVKLAIDCGWVIGIGGDGQEFDEIDLLRWAEWFEEFGEEGGGGRSRH